MSGKSENKKHVLERREKVMGLLSQDFTFATIAKTLEVSERTIERDWKAIREEWLKPKIDDAEAFVDRTIAVIERDLEKLAHMEREARESKKWGLARIIMRQRQSLREELMRVRQSTNRAPKASETVNVNQRIIENPLEGLTISPEKAQEILNEQGNAGSGVVKKPK